MTQAWLEPAPFLLRIPHSPLDLVSVPGLGRDGVQSQFLASPFSQLPTVTFSPVNDEDLRLLIKIGQGHLQLALSSVRREVEPLDLGVDGTSPPMNHKLSPLKQYSSRTSGDLEAYHEYGVLLLRCNVFHVED